MSILRLESPNRRLSHPIAYLLPFALVLAGMVLAGTVCAQGPKVMRVSAVKSMFSDFKEEKIKELTKQFEELMFKHTGLKGDVHTSADAFALGEQLDKGDIDLGLFHGFEFAWAQEKYPKLKPLMVCVNKEPYASVQMVVRKDGKIDTFADLKGKKVNLPSMSGGHCDLYVDRHCAKLGSARDKFFGKLERPESMETALDDVVSKTVDAAIVDSVALENYFIVKPGCKPLLKTLDKSELFPPAVVVYCEGKLDQKTLDIFTKGMLDANKDPKSRGLMSLWKMTAFETVPNSFQPALDKIRKAYPPPGKS